MARENKVEVLGVVDSIEHGKNGATGVANYTWVSLFLLYGPCHPEYEVTHRRVRRRDGASSHEKFLHH